MPRRDAILAFKIKFIEKDVIKPDLSAVNIMEADNGFEQDRFSRTASADYKVCFSRFK